jgi:hypothetical protein
MKPNLIDRRCALLCLLWALLRAPDVLAAQQLPEKMHQLAVNSIELAYQEQFKEAENEAKKIVRNFPDHPAGYFFCAFVLDLQMTYYQSDAQEIEFYQYCNLAIAKGEKRLEKAPNDIWTLFFVAGAKGAKGTYESRFHRWISAFRNGWQGVVGCREIAKRDSRIYDVLFGLGTYDYWRSALTEQVWWMPGVADRRPEAIKMIACAADSGTYVRQASAYHLVAILINEKRFKEALELADTMLQRYAHSFLFAWGRSQALLGLGRYADAEAGFQAILRRIQGEGFKNNYCLAMCRYYLSKVYFGQKNFPRCIKEIENFTALTFPDDTRKRLEETIADVAVMRKAASGN